jgi:hypothetical protein
MSKTSGKLLTVHQAADRLGTSVRFPRRLIAERGAVDELIASGTVEPIDWRRRGVA